MAKRRTEVVRGTAAREADVETLSADQASAEIDSMLDDCRALRAELRELRRTAARSAEAAATRQNERHIVHRTKALAIHNISHTESAHLERRGILRRCRLRGCHGLRRLAAGAGYKAAQLGVESLVESVAE